MSNKVQMPNYSKVSCVQCGHTDTVVWGFYGSEQPCLNCDAAPVFLSQGGNYLGNKGSNK